eukprot:6086102-Prymnesium_polylepis.1
MLYEPFTHLTSRGRRRRLASSSASQPSSFIQHGARRRRGQLLCDSQQVRVHGHGTVVAQTLGYVDVLSPAFQSLVRVGGGVKSPPRASPGPRAH